LKNVQINYLMTCRRHYKLKKMSNVLTMSDRAVLNSTHLIILRIQIWIMRSAMDCWRSCTFWIKLNGRLSMRIYSM
jgi:glyoxylate utilization-related uncharacterized protein